MASSGFKKYLDALVDDDGIKTEVTITLTDRTMAKLSAYALGTVILGSLAFFYIRHRANLLKTK